MGNENLSPPAIQPTAPAAVTGESSEPIASYVRDISGFQGNAKLYRLAPPLDGHEYVIVSAVVAMFSGPETYIFGATKDGKVANWVELAGSFRGDLDHERALRGAGYEVRP